LKAGNAALAVVCGPDGSLRELIYDELGLREPAARLTEFTSMVAAFQARRANRFLEAIRAKRAALDWKLNLELPQGNVPLFFSGAAVADGIVIIGTKEPLSDAAASVELEPPDGRHAEAIEAALREIQLRKEEAIERKSGRQRRAARRSPGVKEPGGEAGHGRVQPGAQRPILESAAHDLRNPVSSVLAAAQYLIEEAGAALEPHQLTMLRSIESSARLMLLLLDDMVEVPAADAGKMGLELHPTDIGSLVEHGLAISRPMAETKRVSLELVVRKPLPRVAADPVKLSNAMERLLMSAIRSTESDGRIEVMVHGQADHVAIRLRQVPPGQSAEALRSLFHPPHALRPKGRPPDDRTALTVAQVRRIVEAHHGTVQVEDEARQAISVMVTLPVSPGVRTRESRRTDRVNGGRTSGQS